MANTFTQIYVHYVFVVSGRQNMIHEDSREKLEKYICGIVKNYKSKPMAIYCNPDHTHILVSLNPSVSVSNMAKVIKSNSSRWINENKRMVEKFSWQKGFGAFTYSKSQIDKVVKYILNQPSHHKNRSFQDEYVELLEKFQIEFDKKYLFDLVE
jgi:putative transposase